MVRGTLFQVLGFLYCLHIRTAVALGTAGSIAVSYGAKGQSLCRVFADSGNLILCYGNDEASVFGAPPRMPMTGLTGGDGFVCGLSQDDKTPYCWGNNIYVPAGIPTLPDLNRTYVGLSAGDNHLCALRGAVDGNDGVSLEVDVVRKKSGGGAGNTSVVLGPWVDCWGYNMTGSYIYEPLVAITAGSFFTCGLYASNRTPICWGDDNGYGVITGVPPLSFSSIAAGGYHVCGILRQNNQSSPPQTLCWGRTLESPQPNTTLSSLVGGKFHSCGLRSGTQAPVCWGLSATIQVSSAENVSLQAMVAGDYFTCGIFTATSGTVCWGSSYPLPVEGAASPGSQTPDKNCSGSSSPCPPAQPNNNLPSPPSHSSTIQVPIIIGEIVTAVVIVCALLVGVYFWVRCKLHRAAVVNEKLPTNASSADPSSAQTKKGSVPLAATKFKAVSARHEEPKNPRAHMYKYEELEGATSSFSKENEIGRGSFSVVYKGTLPDGAVVAVKRAMGSAGSTEKVPESSKEFRNELDLLSRLNHAHLLNLLGFCEEGGERLLVYEYMANGSLFEHLHGDREEQLGWVTRLTVAVQAARGLEYLHGYACHPVIHRDIKSCNILLDEEWNARVADFGLSLFGPENSNCPLSEPPAGTLGYLDPEYYRLHYLTTKSDVYSFGVLLLEIMSGRKAIDMAYPQGNIVEWAVPLIKAGLTRTILDNRIEDPQDLDALDKLSKVAAQCVRMRGKDRPSMEKVTTSVERALALMLGTSATDGQLILPTEVVLGSARLHKKTSSRRTSSSHKSISESRKSDSEFGEPAREREDFMDGPASMARARGLFVNSNNGNNNNNLSCEDGLFTPRGACHSHLSSEDDLQIPRVQSLGRVQSFSKVGRNIPLSRAYSFSNRAYSHRTASSSRVDEEDDLEIESSFGSPPFQIINSLRAVDQNETQERQGKVPRDIPVDDSWERTSNQHKQGDHGNSSTLAYDDESLEISAESPRYFGHGRTEGAEII